MPYTLILETSKGIIVIKNTEHDFAHLVGKQYSMNLEIQKLDTKRFFMRVLTHKISYDNTFLFNTILSNDFDLMNRFNSLKKNSRSQIL